MALSIEPLFNDPVNGDFYKKAFLYLTEPGKYPHCMRLYALV